ncbi:MAG: hypothetical protein FWD46_07040 [Cystobacterineae bacterium]|nr:hypothetical protein [Cystobacterineae bacterium]
METFDGMHFNEELAQKAKRREDTPSSFDGGFVGKGHAREQNPCGLGWFRRLNKWYNG